MILFLMLLAIPFLNVCADDPDRKSRKLNGGQIVTDKTLYPFMAALLDNGELVCSGSIVGKNEILTSAHCTYPFSSKPDLFTRFKVIVGTTNLEDKEMEVEVKEFYYIEDFYNDPKVNSEFDICTIVLKEDLIFNDFIKEIKIDKKFVLLPDNTPAKILGFGSGELQELDVKIQKWCHFKDFHISKEFQFVTEKMVKVGGTPKDAGGPVIINGSQVGVFSFGVLASGVCDVSIRTSMASDVIVVKLSSEGNETYTLRGLISNLS